MKKTLVFLLLPLFTTAQDTVNQRLLDQAYVGRERLKTYQGKPFTGHAATYDERGRLATTTAYAKGKRQGNFERYEYLPSGDTGKMWIAQEALFNADTIAGKMRYYHFNGKLERETEYLRNRQHGKETWYDINGKRKEQYFYRLGKREGRYSAWWPNDSLRVLGEYSADQPSGAWTYYYGDGRSRKTESYTAGKVYDVKWEQGVSLLHKNDTNHFAFNGIHLLIPSLELRFNDDEQLRSDTLEMEQSAGGELTGTLIMARSYSVKDIELFVVGERRNRGLLWKYTTPVKLQCNDWFYSYPKDAPPQEPGRVTLLIVKGKLPEGKKLIRVFRITPVSGC